MTFSANLRARFSERGDSAFHLDVSLRMETGETLVILGPSGSGKSLILETLAGLHAHEGEILLEDMPFHDKRPEKRGFGYVFQEHALWPHKNVRDNVAFGYRGKEGGKVVQNLLELLDIAHLAERHPATLSGGECQRVALARALAVHPRLLLLDEPLSSLDLPARENMRRHLLDHLSDSSAVYVTHDRDEARMLADRIVVIRNGRVVQEGTTDEIFSAPADPFVARFTGANCVALNRLPAAFRAHLPAGQGEYLIVRPERIQLCETGPDRLQGRVLRVMPESGRFRVSVAFGSGELDVLSPAAPAVEASVGLRMPEHGTRLI